MHKALVAQVEIVAMDPDVLRHFYALLFGWRFSPDEGEPRNSFVSTADSNGVGGAITRAGDSDSRGLRLIVEVDDVFENLCYADELGGRIIDPPHEVMSAGRRVTVASFVDPEGNRVGLSNGLQNLASARQLPA
jgi:predicted enzyme related to lactoylglutathione lyase